MYHIRSALIVKRLPLQRLHRTAVLKERLHLTKLSSFRYYTTTRTGNEVRESDDVDVCIVGGGPSGLSAAIRLKQLAKENGSEDLRVVLIDKGPEIGSHIVSGAVLDPRALNELFESWKDDEELKEMVTPAKSGAMYYLTKNRSIRLPAPKEMHNKGNFILSLSQFTRWLAAKAESLGVEVYPGFSAAEILYDQDGKVKGVATGDLGLDRQRQKKESYEPGLEFHAKMTLFAEGAHGSLTKQLVKKFDLRKESGVQHYGLGCKEVWEVPESKFKPGEIIHSMGWPLSNDVYGGAWMYHFGKNLVSIGLVVGLDYSNPTLSPYAEFQRMKLHPIYSKVIEDGKCIAYGARALNEGGYQSIPVLAFPGGALIGCSAGFVNIAKIKGIHTAMKSGMIAAESYFEALKKDNTGPMTLETYDNNIKNSWITDELYRVRNIYPSMRTKLGVLGGVFFSGIDSLVLRGKAPYTLRLKTADFSKTKPYKEVKPIEYPKADGKLTFDILTSVSRTGTMHEEDEPIHLVDTKPKERNKSYELYRGIEKQFCPAAVYEWIEDPQTPNGMKFQINSQNCIHCKTCDIKDPLQNINWETPQGGDGPKYSVT